MDKIEIVGGRALKGEVTISGAKNAALPLMVAALLTSDQVTLSNMPELEDINTLVELMETLGVKIERDKKRRTMTLQADALKEPFAPYDIVRKMRASMLVMGPLTARTGHSRVSLPGGCSIGARLVDMHEFGLRILGAEVNVDEGYLVTRVPKKRLKGAVVRFAKRSVGATQDILMAAALADGVSVLENCNVEPEITNLAELLVAMGAKIDGIGTQTLTVRGRKQLHGADFTVIPDRIETGTYILAAGITGGKIALKRSTLAYLPAESEVWRRMGLSIEEKGGVIIAKGPKRPAAADFSTGPYPLFATDMQAQTMAMATAADGKSVICESIYENRFMHVPELARMGARIDIVDGSTAVVAGVKRLKGAEVMASDLRASASLILAGLAAQGRTTVNRVYHLYRGYTRMAEKLAALGADIRTVK